MIKVLLAVLMLVAADYLILHNLNAYEFKYFVVLHGTLIGMGLVLFGLLQWLKKSQPSYVGMGMMAGLVMKMILMTALFIVLHRKSGMTDTQIVNYLIIYSIYTALITYYAVLQLKFNK